VSKPPITATLTWQGDLRFRAETPRNAITIDADSAAGPSPVDALALALAGCMAIDVVDIIKKGRHPLASLEARVSGERRDDPPRRFTRFTLIFILGGNVPAHVVQRAIDLSRDKYCSVWHSLREDIELDTSFDVTPAPFDSANG
jgi:putative redox protein